MRLHEVLGVNAERICHSGVIIEEAGDLGSIEQVFIRQAPRAKLSRVAIIDAVNIHGHLNREIEQGPLSLR